MIGVTGAKWSGKSVFASMIDPAGTFYVDLEDSIASYNFPYKKSVSLYDSLVASGIKNPKPVDVYRWFVKTVDEIKAGDYTVLVIDPISDLEAGMVQYVESNPTEFGYTKGQFDRAPGLIWAAVKQHWKLLLGLLAAKVETFVFTTHLGTVWVDGKPIKGKAKPKGKDVLEELASLYLWLVREKDDKGKLPEIPSARVQKSRLAVIPVIGGKVGTPRNILPPGIENCDPDAIRRYILNPPNWDKLKKNELAPEVTQPLTEDERLELQATIAEKQAETARLNAETKRLLVEHEQMQLQSRRSAETRSASVPDAAPTETSSNAAGATASNAANTEKPLDPLLGGVQEVRDDHDKKQALQEIAALKKELGINDEQWKKVLEKRKVSTARDLPADQALELADSLKKLKQKRIDDAKKAASAEPAGVASGN